MSAALATKALLGSVRGGGTSLHIDLEPAQQPTKIYLLSQLTLELRGWILDLDRIFEDQLAARPESRRGDFQQVFHQSAQIRNWYPLAHGWVGDDRVDHAQA